jgi:hypothetical protein
MALGFYFSPENMSTGQYDEAIRRLESAGQGNPAGRLYHIAWEDPSGFHVFDVWDTEESWAKFGETLMPILGELGVDPGQPHISEVHNIIQG